MAHHKAHSPSPCPKEPQIKFACIVRYYLRPTRLDAWLRFAPLSARCVMPLNEQDARALTYLAMRVRAETPGAGAWDEHGTFTNVRKLAGRSLAMTAEHIIRHAADPKAKTPGVLAGTFTPPPTEPTKRGNPKRGEDCRRHMGQWPDNCAGCKTDANPATQFDPPVADAVREVSLAPNLAAKLSKILNQEEAS